MLIRLPTPNEPPVQHVESLNDVVARIVGIVVRETVPDAIVERPDEIELVDLPPDDLLERLREGNVHIPEQARHAAERFFRRENLVALRELALRQTAERVGAETTVLSGEHFADEILAFAEQRNITKIVVGKPEPGRARLLPAPL
jgi:two-component system sensor histidine kinase KdpD